MTTPRHPLPLAVHPHLIRPDNPANDYIHDILANNGHTDRPQPPVQAIHVYLDALDVTLALRTYAAAAHPRPEHIDLTQAPDAITARVWAYDLIHAHLFYVLGNRVETPAGTEVDGRMTDRDALDRIHSILALSSTWTTTTAARIADVLARTDRPDGLGDDIREVDAEASRFERATGRPFVALFPESPEPEPLGG